MAKKKVDARTKAAQKEQVEKRKEARAREEQTRAREEEERLAREMAEKEEEARAAQRITNTVRIVTFILVALVVVICLIFVSRRTRNMTIGDSAYPELLEGELTKEELTFVLSCLPQELSDVQNQDLYGILQGFASAVGSQFLVVSQDASLGTGLDAEAVNRLFSVFTDFQFSDEAATGCGEVTKDGVIWLHPEEGQSAAQVEITEGVRSGTTLTVTYSYTDEDGTRTLQATAEETEEERFRIVQIGSAQE